MSTQEGWISEPGWEIKAYPDYHAYLRRKTMLVWHRRHEKCDRSFFEYQTSQNWINFLCLQCWRCSCDHRRPSIPDIQCTPRIPESGYRHANLVRYFRNHSNVGLWLVVISHVPHNRCRISTLPTHRPEESLASRHQIDFTCGATQMTTL